LKVYEFFSRPIQIGIGIGIDAARVLDFDTDTDSDSDDKVLINFIRNDGSPYFS